MNRPRLDAVLDPRPPGPVLLMSRDGGGVRLHWTADAYELEAAETPQGPWTGVVTSNKSHAIEAPGSPGFFRLHRAGH
jgi:hypothetical protein